MGNWKYYLLRSTLFVISSLTWYLPSIITCDHQSVCFLGILALTTFQVCFHHFHLLHLPNTYPDECIQPAEHFEYYCIVDENSNVCYMSNLSSTFLQCVFWSNFSLRQSNIIWSFTKSQSCIGNTHGLYLMISWKLLEMFTSSLKSGVYYTLLISICQAYVPYGTCLASILALFGVLAFLILLIYSIVAVVIFLVINFIDWYKCSLDGYVLCKYCTLAG